MIFTNPKFIKFIDDKLYFDVDVVEGDRCFPYTYLESDTPTNAIDVEIKKALDTKKLVVDTSTKIVNNVEKSEPKFDLWSYRNQAYQKFRMQYYEILRLSYVEYKHGLFYIGDVPIFNGYYILNKTVSYLDAQNDEVLLNQDDFKKLIELSLSKKQVIMNEYRSIKNQLAEANTKQQIDDIEWNLE